MQRKSLVLPRRLSVSVAAVRATRRVGKKLLHKKQRGLSHRQKGRLNKKRSPRSNSRSRKYYYRLHSGGSEAGGDVPDNALVDVRLDPMDPTSPIVLMSKKQADKEVYNKEDFNSSADE